MSPSINHSYLCKKILVEIERSEQWEAWPEMTLNIDAGLIPDIAIYERGQVKPNFDEDRLKCDLLPRLVIEIASPSQSIHELMQKAEKFRRAGVPAVWTIEPYGKVIYMSTATGRNVVVNGVVASEGVTVDFRNIFC